ncbi:MAG: DUF3127 domain-containing protein [Phycisphaerales bacterium]|nr:DUF3127 domain-containing protein [Phycisphaerales bacterium]
MSDFKITGRILTIEPIVERTIASGPFKTRVLVIEETKTIASTGKSFINYISCQLTQDKTALVDKYKEGEEVTITFNIRGSKWVNKEGITKYITNLDVWRIEKVGNNTTYPTPPPPNNSNNQEPLKPAGSYFDNNGSTGDDSDLPF